MSDQKVDVLKEDFNWEVPHEVVPLPSQGEMYSPDSKLYKLKKLEIKAMTAKEEDLLTSQALLKTGRAVSEVLKSCITTKNINIDDLLIGDKNALMTAVRITGYGSEYPASVRCGACSFQNNVDINLTELPIKFLEIEPVTPGQNRFEYTLPVTKKKIQFKFLTGHDEKERKETLENMQRHFGKDYEPNVTMFLENVILSVEGIEDKNKIKHFVQHLPAYDSRSLRNYIKDNEPGIDLVHNLTCSNCGAHSEVAVPVTAKFFWPDS